MGAHAQFCGGGTSPPLPCGIAGRWGEGAGEDGGRGRTGPEGGLGLLVEVPDLRVLDGEHAEAVRVVRQEGLHRRAHLGPRPRRHPRGRHLRRLAHLSGTHPAPRPPPPPSPRPAPPRPAPRRPAPPPSAPAPPAPPRRLCLLPLPPPDRNRFEKKFKFSQGFPWPRSPEPPRGRRGGGSSRWGPQAYPLR